VVTDDSRSCLLAAALLFAVLAPGGACGQVPSLPEGARTRWVVGQVEEIVSYLTFDTAGVEGRLPRALRFVTVQELAAGGARWAADYLLEHPAHGRCGVSFLELVRAGTFTIDGRSPLWPENGAAALWCARVAPADPSADLGPGRPLLLLDLWMPDRAYVDYMLGKGHHAAYGDVRLVRDASGSWRGSVEVAGLSVDARCTPGGPVSGGPGSAGMQALFPPQSSAAPAVVRVAFAGHREQECGGEPSWVISGMHPLAGGVALPPALFEYGYDLVGGAYPRPWD
jgi:hypothetical protein